MIACLDFRKNVLSHFGGLLKIDGPIGDTCQPYRLDIVDEQLCWLVYVVHQRRLLVTHIGISRVRWLLVEVYHMANHAEQTEQHVLPLHVIH